MARLSFAACQKENNTQQQGVEAFSSAAVNANAETAPFNMEAIFRGEGNGFGHVKLRQDNNAAKIIILDTWVRAWNPITINCYNPP